MERRHLFDELSKKALVGREGGRGAGGLAQSNKVERGLTEKCCADPCLLGVGGGRRNLQRGSQGGERRQKEKG